MACKAEGRWLFTLVKVLHSIRIALYMKENKLLLYTCSLELRDNSILCVIARSISALAFWSGLVLILVLGLSCPG